MQEVGILYKYAPQFIFLILLHGTSWCHTVMINYLRDKNTKDREAWHKAQEELDKAQYDSIKNTIKEYIIIRFALIEWLKVAVVILMIDIFLLLIRILLSFTSRDLLLPDIAIVVLFVFAQLIFFAVFVFSYCKRPRTWFKNYYVRCKKYQNRFATFISLSRNQSYLPD